MRKALFALDNSIDPARLASFCLKTGVDSLILNPEFFEDDSFLETLRRNGCAVWLNLPVFFDPQYLDENPEAYSITSTGNRAIHSWLHMACPSHERFLDHKLKEFGDLLRRVHPDYISYDFIRFYVSWEEVELANSPEGIEHGCYCPRCRERFARFSGEELLVQDGTAGRRQRDSVGRWKRNVIEDTVRSLNAVVEETAKGTPVYINTIPWRKSDLENARHWIAGQDPASLGRMSDGIIPMAFTQILGQTPSWKKSVLDQVALESGTEVMSYVQLEPLIRDTAISNQQLEQEIVTAIAEERAGLIYFHYEQIIDDDEKQQILSKYRHR